jgi:hypothetical protein
MRVHVHQLTPSNNQQSSSTMDTTGNEQTTLSPRALARQKQQEHRQRYRSRSRSRSRSNSRDSHPHSHSHSHSHSRSRSGSSSSSSSRRRRRRHKHKKKHKTKHKTHKTHKKHKKHRHSDRHDSPIRSPATTSESKSISKPTAPPKPEYAKTVRARLMFKGSSGTDTHAASYHHGKKKSKKKHKKHHKAVSHHGGVVIDLESIKKNGTANVSDATRALQQRIKGKSDRFCK